MKKIISLILLASVALFALASCTPTETPAGPTEKDYTLAIGMYATGNTAEGRNNGKIGANVAVLVLDADNKIVAARLDTIEYKIKASAGLNLTAPTSKMELGTEYGMADSAEKGEWDVQMKWLENFLVGKTAADVAALTMDDLKAGCTIGTTVTDQKVAIANAFASTTKTAFKATGDFTVGAKLMMSVSNKTAEGAADYNVAVDAEAAGVVVQDGKIVASTLDAIQTTMTANAELTATAFAVSSHNENPDSKRAQGDAYMMSGRSWATQADAFCAATVGKAATELDSVSAAGCTMPYSQATFKANLAAAMGLAR